MGTIPKQPKLVLGPESAGMLMTPEEFDAITAYHKHYRYELIHGVVVVSPIPKRAETDPNEELGHWLRSYQERHPQGTALDLTLPQQYVPTRTSRRLADRLIWTGLGRLPDRLRDLPSIAIELVSAGRRNRQRDYVEKRQEYLAVGIAEYWIVDRFQRTLTVVRNQPTGPEEIVIHEHETYRTPLLPGFELPLSRFLAMADRWAQAE